MQRCQKFGTDFIYHAKWAIQEQIGVDQSHPRDRMLVFMPIHRLQTHVSRIYIFSTWFPQKHFLCRIVYDKYFKESFPSGDRKTRLYLKIGPKNEDRNYMKEFYVYGWTDFFADMGSYIGLLLGWSALTILEMTAELIEILAQKKMSLSEILNKKETSTQIVS